jgi:hypothetical protein
LQLLLTAPSQSQVGVWRGAGLLDETVQRDEMLLVKAEQHARSALGRQIGTNFPQTTPQRPTKRHPDGPTLLRAQQIFAYGLALGLRERFQPVAHWFVACAQAKETSGIFRG